MWKDARRKKSRCGWIVRKPRCVRTLPMRASNCAGIWPGGNADMTKHPNETVLALFAGGDLGTWQRWRVERHVASCAACRQEVAEFSELCATVPAMMEPPEISWTKLAVEMKANIRLGLEAGECVSAGQSEIRGFFSLRALAVCGSLALLLAAFLLERPAPLVGIMKASEAPFMESSGS